MPTTHMNNTDARARTHTHTLNPAISKVGIQYLLSPVEQVHHSETAKHYWTAVKIQLDEDESKLL